MRKAKEMVDYALANKFYFYSGGGINHFEVIENILTCDECVFISLLPIFGKNQEVCAVALTNKRIIVGKKLIFGGNEVFAVDLNNVIAIKKTTLSWGLSTIHIETLNGCLQLTFDKKQSEKIFSTINEFIKDYRDSQLQ